MSSEKKQVFIIGSKGIPAQYGGFETFVEKLTEYQKDNTILCSMYECRKKTICTQWSEML